MDLFKLIVLIVAVTIVVSATVLTYVGRLSSEQYMHIIEMMVTLVATLGGVAVYAYVRERKEGGK